MVIMTEGRLGRLIDKLRSTPQATIEKRILEAFDSLGKEGISEADGIVILERIESLHPSRTWKDYSRIGRVHSGLTHLEQGGLVTHEIRDGVKYPLVYRRLSPQASPQGQSQNP